MTRMLEWGAIQVNRRGFLARAAAVTFGIFAGAAAGIPEVAYAGTCQGPYGSGYCAPENCNSNATCKNMCSSVDCCCYGNPSGCWNTTSSHKCCDCGCYRPPTGSYFCVCHGNQ